jgi:hypothetical protein
MRDRVFAVTLLALTFLLCDRDAGQHASAEVVARSARAVGSTWEHRYRVGGKVRLLVFWAGSDDVGGARLSRRMDASGGSTISFLAGSNPERAPRNLNRWGYVLEHQAGPAGGAFIVRSIDHPGPAGPPVRVAAGAGNALFGAGCSSMRGDSEVASVTSVRVEQDLTFRQFDRMLSTIDASRWEQRPGTPAAGAYPGFFTALQAAIDETVSAGDRVVPRPRAYLFNGALFDLLVRGVKRAGAGLLRGQYAYRNRQTGEGSDFTVVFETVGDRAGIPIAMTFMPSWWMKVELTLDEQADVPRDPARDSRLSQQIQHMCARVLSGSTGEERTEAGWP